MAMMPPAIDEALAARGGRPAGWSGREVAAIDHLHRPRGRGVGVLWPKPKDTLLAPLLFALLLLLLRIGAFTCSATPLISSFFLAIAGVSWGRHRRSHASLTILGDRMVTFSSLFQIPEPSQAIDQGRALL